MSNKHFFTGECTYLVQAEIKKRKNAFVEKYGAEWVHIIHPDNYNLTTIQSALMGGGFFSTKSLTILYGLPRDNFPTNKVKAADATQIEDFLMKHREQITPENVILLVSYKPDKRTRSYKFFDKNSTKKEFKVPKGKALSSFVSAKLWSLISWSQADLIVSRVWDDLHNLSNEWDKLIQYADFHSLDKLTDEQIELVTYSQSQINSFDILDVLFTKPEKALHLIDRAQKEWSDMFMFLGMLYRGLKMILGMIDLHLDWVKSSKDIASKLKVHPFALMKQHKHIQTFVKLQPQIQSLYHKLLTIDREIKTGQIPAEAFWVNVKRSIV